MNNIFSIIYKTDGELRRTVRDALMCVTSAFVLNKDDESNLALMNALLSAHIESPESSVRHVLNTHNIYRFVFRFYLSFQKHVFYSNYSHLVVRPYKIILSSVQICGDALRCNCISTR